MIINQQNDKDSITKGSFEFLEFASQNPRELEVLFKQLGFIHIANHKLKKIKLFRQGKINFILNEESRSHADQFYLKHGPSVCSMGLVIKKALKTSYFKKINVISQETRSGFFDHTLYPIKGIGDTLLFLVNIDNQQSLYQKNFNFIQNIETNLNDSTIGLKKIDHITFNVYKNQTNYWVDFYTSLFNFKETRFFDIRGSFSGLSSRVITSPDREIKIPINEPVDEKSQIAEYLRKHKGSGVQHIALSTNNICETIEKLKANGIKFLWTPDAYYKRRKNKFCKHSENFERLKKNRILIDGDHPNDTGFLLQIFTKTYIGPIFFEIIQREDHQGFGEGNFQALFESIEQEQIEQGLFTKPLKRTT